MAASSKVLTMPPCMTPAYPCQAGSASMVATTEPDPSGKNLRPRDAPLPQTMQSAWFAGGSMHRASFFSQAASGLVERGFNRRPVIWRAGASARRSAVAGRRSRIRNDQFAGGRSQQAVQQCRGSCGGKILGRAGKLAAILELVLDVELVRDSDLGLDRSRWHVPCPSLFPVLFQGFRY